MTRYQFVIEGEVTEPPPDHLQKLETYLRREVQFMLGETFDVVLAQIVDWCRVCLEPFDSDEGCDDCIKEKTCP